MEGLPPALLQVVIKQYELEDESQSFLLPPPDWPTRATILPGGSFSVKSLSTLKPGLQG